MKFGKLIKTLRGWHKANKIKKIEIKEIKRGDETIGHYVTFLIQHKK